MSKRLLLMPRVLVLLFAVWWFSLGSAAAFDLGISLFEGREEPQEITWRELVQLDYKQSVVPPNLQKLNGKIVKIPGYVVPLLGDFGGDFETLREFLLVPVYGMCIHVPPPPPNQVIYIQMEQPVPVEDLFDAVWVTGLLRVEIEAIPNTEGLMYEPESGFHMTGLEVVRYKRE
jgi:hypothetical protein